MMRLNHIMRRDLERELQAHYLSEMATLASPLPNNNCGLGWTILRPKITSSHDIESTFLSIVAQCKKPQGLPWESLERSRICWRFGRYVVLHPAPARRHRRPQPRGGKNYGQ